MSIVVLLCRPRSITLDKHPQHQRARLAFAHFHVNAPRRLRSRAGPSTDNQKAAGKIEKSFTLANRKDFQGSQ
jgi:hypothetical protein